MISGSHFPWSPSSRTRCRLSTSDGESWLNQRKESTNLFLDMKHTPETLPSYIKKSNEEVEGQQIALHTRRTKSQQAFNLRGTAPDRYKFWALNGIYLPSYFPTSAPVTSWRPDGRRLDTTKKTTTFKEPHSPFPLGTDGLVRLFLLGLASAWSCIFLIFV